jgi:hypothetical protein
MKRKVLYRDLKILGTRKGKPLETVHSTLGKIEKQEIILLEKMTRIA